MMLGPGVESSPMCGLVTILAPEPRRDLARTADRMAETIAHRGPDGRGLLALESTCPPDARAEQIVQPALNPAAPVRIALAHRRLAVQDTSEAGLQPMASADGSAILSFNGEIYNFRQLAHELTCEGVHFRTGCDTELLVELLAREGIECLPRLEGMFAFSLVDTRSGRLFVARDRFGIKPLYLWRAPQGELCIASEIKALTAHPDWRARANTPRVLDYLNRGVIDHVPGETLFADVCSLCPGTWAAFSLDDARQVDAGRWFDLEHASPPQGRSLADLLDRSVRQHLISDVPVGSCLSGGIDSSAIVALAARALHEKSPNANFHAIHARADDPHIDESASARQLAQHAHVQLHEVTPTGAELFDRLDQLVWAQDEPFGSPSIFAQFKLIQCARELGLKVMLDGQGADEQLCGYHAFFKAALAEHFASLHFLRAHMHAHAVRKLHGVGLVSQVAQALAGLAPSGVRSLLRTRLGTRKPLLAHDPSSGPGTDPFDALPHGWRSVRGFCLDQLLAASLPMLLHWEDRNSMHFGVEARVPFLNHDLVAHSLSLPTDAKLCRGVTKWALRESMRGLVPDAILDRTDKVAFATPEERWVRSDSRTPDLVAQGLDAASQWMTDRAREQVTASANGEGAYDNAAWRVLCFGAWVKRFDVQLEHQPG